MTRDERYALARRYTETARSDFWDGIHDAIHEAEERTARRCAEIVMSSLHLYEGEDLHWPMRISKECTVRAIREEFGLTEDAPHA